MPGTGTGEANLVFNCDGFNAFSGCAAAVCKIEGKFVLDTFNYFITGGQVDHSMHHAANFDYANTCVGNGKNQGPSEKACCGDFPIRSPFKTYDGTRACCGGSIYDATIKECCADGSPKLQC